jgi:DNA-binding IclR family transcriptional regulator
MKEPRLRKGAAAPAAASGTQAIERAAQLLRQVASAPRGGAPLAQLVDALGVSRPTAFRIASCLEREGFLYRDPDNRNYVLGDFFANLSGGVGAHESLRKLSEERMRRLAARTGHTVYLIVRVGDDGRCILRQEGSSAVRIVTIDEGTQRPLGIGAGGMAILAALPAAEQKEVIARNLHRYGLFSNLTESKLRQQLAATRRQGYALNAAQASLGVRSLGQVIRNAAGEPMAALSLSGPGQRIAEKRDELASQLAAETREVERELAR